MSTSTLAAPAATDAPAFQATVYSKPDCPQCDMTYLKLDREGITYNVIDITKDPEALKIVREGLGYLQAPVVYVSPDLHWSGFKPDQIVALARSLNSAQAA